MLFKEELINNTYYRQYWIYKHDSFYQQRIANAGPYQQSNLQRLRNLVPKPNTIIDVGMNIGMNTIEYATWAKTVHGFEPTKQTYSMATRNIDLAKKQTIADLPKSWYKNEPMTIVSNIHTYNNGLGSEPGEFEILIKKDNAGHNHIENIDVPLPSGKKRHRGVEPTKEKIIVKTLDSYNFENVDIIKVDTEGYEFPVVMGAEKTILKWLPVVQLEMVESQPERFGYTCQQIYDWFLERDFIISLADGTNCGTKWEWHKKRMERFFIHKSKDRSTFSTFFE